MSGVALLLGVAGFVLLHQMRQAAPPGAPKPGAVAPPAVGQEGVILPKELKPQGGLLTPTLENQIRIYYRNPNNSLAQGSVTIWFKPPGVDEKDGRVATLAYYDIPKQGLMGIPVSPPSGGRLSRWGFVKNDQGELEYRTLDTRGQIVSQGVIQTQRGSTVLRMTQIDGKELGEPILNQLSERSNL